MKATPILAGQKNCDYEKPEKTKILKKKALIKLGQLDRVLGVLKMETGRGHFFRLSHASGRSVPILQH